MSAQPRARLPALLLLTLLAALTACAPPSLRAPATGAAGWQQQAGARAAAGDFLGAAQLYLQRAAGEPDARAAALRVEAAEYLLEGGHREEAADVLDGVDVALLDTPLLDRLLLARARIALDSGDVDSALEQLDRIRQPDTLPDGGAAYYRLKARAYRLAGDALEAARQLIWLDGLLPDDERLDNQLAIWQLLSGLPDEALQRLRGAAAADATLAGWIDLVLLVHQDLRDTTALYRSLDAWQLRYADHPARDFLLPRLQAQLGRGGQRVDRIALLLPLSGRTAESAAAIRDGVLAALYRDDEQRPVLTVYDTGTADQSVWDLYQQALLDGAQFVIGPLLKDNIRQLARSGQLDVPVLALNQIDDELAPDLPLYQFGLSPEDEAQQVAERARADGLQRMIAIVPDNHWGQRLLSAFGQRWRLLDGDLRESQSFRRGSADFSGPIQRALNLDSSKQRHRALERLLGRSIAFEPRRRQDVDGIFIAAFPREARLLRPQLRFHRAGDLPVYSTSHVYTGKPDPVHDRDMDGLMFCDIPWVLDAAGNWADLRNRIERLWPRRAARHQRLFALGTDAYQVIPWLDTLNTQGFGFYSGATGILTMDGQRKLHRELVWARFRRGRPEPLSLSPSDDSTGRSQSTRR